MAGSFQAETVWLKNYLELWSCDVFFSADVEASMRREKISRVDLLHVLKNAQIASVENLDRTRSVWNVTGSTCDDEGMQLELHVSVNDYRLEITEAERERLGESDGEMQEMRLRRGRMPDAS